MVLLYTACQTPFQNKQPWYVIDSDLNFAAVPFYLPGMPKQNPAAQHLQNQNLHSSIIIWIGFSLSVSGSVSKMEAILFLYLVQKK